MMNTRWFMTIIIIPILSMIIGSYVWQNTSTNINKVESQCVVVPNLSNGTSDNRLSLPDGTIIEENNAGNFVVPCKYNGNIATLHNISTKKFLGKFTLNLNTEKPQILSSSDISNY